MVRGKATEAEDRLAEMTQEARGPGEELCQAVAAATQGSPHPPAVSITEWDHFN